MSRLRTESLCKSFGRLAVTKNVSLDIAAGERRAIIGPNGAGKTSLLNQIGGQLRPSSGRILLDELDLTGRPPEVISRRGIARTFQRNNLFAGLEAIENVRLAVEIRRGNPLNFYATTDARDDIIGRAADILDLVGLREHAHRRVAQLSYGIQRQLEIAVALASEPAVLLLDEPTAGMSPNETSRMTDIIAALPRSLTLVMIEHDMDVVFSLAERITVLHYGEVLATGSPEEIKAHPRVRDVYLGVQ